MANTTTSTSLLRSCLTTLLSPYVWVFFNLVVPLLIAPVIRVLDYCVQQAQNWVKQSRRSRLQLLQNTNVNVNVNVNGTGLGEADTWASTANTSSVTSQAQAALKPNGTHAGKTLNHTTAVIRNRSSRASASRTTTTNNNNNSNNAYEYEDSNTSSETDHEHEVATSVDRDVDGDESKVLSFNQQRAAHVQSQTREYLDESQRTGVIFMKIIMTKRSTVIT